MRIRPRKTQRIIFILLALVLLVVGGAFGWLVADKRYYTAEHAYPLLDPSVSTPSIHSEIINFDPLRQNLKSYFASTGMAHSLYFEYLPNGVNIRDGADTTSLAASLMKTPIIMDLYKLDEVGKLDVNDTVKVKQSDISTDSDYGNPTKLKAGDTMTLKQAAHITMQYSDNTTLNVIKDKVIPLLDNDTDSVQSLDVSYTLSSAEAGNEQVSISARSYSSILKCLYYACFNSPKDSSQIISDLTGSAEQNRLMAGVDSDIKVAHKVGSSDTSQSDCGIVYYPGRPYLVCLMLVNLTPADYPKVDSIFQNVSQQIYNYIAGYNAS